MHVQVALRCIRAEPCCGDPLCCCGTHAAHRGVRQAHSLPALSALHPGQAVCAGPPPVGSPACPTVQQWRPSEMTSWQLRREGDRAAVQMLDVPAQLLAQLHSTSWPPAGDACSLL